MDFSQKLNAAREAYVPFLRNAVGERRKTKEHFAAELMIQPNGSTNPAPFSLLRVDVIYGDPSRPTIERLVDSSESLVEEREFESASGLRVTAGTIGWEEFVVSFDSATFEITRLRDWLERWLDVAETHEEDADGLLGVVHGIGWNHDVPSGWQLSVDLGSAPVDSVLQLFEVFVSAGIDRCRVEPPGTQTDA